MSETKNAKISGTSLGNDGRGLSFWLHLDYGDSTAQGFGGYSLGGEYTHHVLENILRVVGVDKWEQLVGKPIRVKTSLGREIEAIGNYLEDEWWDPSQYGRNR